MLRDYNFIIIHINLYTFWKILHSNRRSKEFKELVVDCDCSDDNKITLFKELAVSKTSMPPPFTVLYIEGQTAGGRTVELCNANFAASQFPDNVMTDVGHDVG